MSLGINSLGDWGSNYHDKGSREGSHRLFAVYESWPPYLFACCFLGDSFFHGSHLIFSWRLSFNVGHAVADVRSSQSRGKPSSRNCREEICHDPCHAKFVAVAVGHQLPLTHRALTVPRYQILRVLKVRALVTWVQIAHVTKAPTFTMGKKNRDMTKIKINSNSILHP